MRNAITWQAPEFEYRHRPHGWYLSVIAAAVLIIAISLWQGNFLFAVFVAVAAVILVRSGAQVPRYIDLRLTSDALVLDNKKVYPYSQFSGFATRRIDDLEDGLSELIFQKKQALGSHFRVLFPAKRSEEIRHFLNQHLHEVEYEDSLMEHVSRWLKF